MFSNIPTNLVLAGLVALIALPFVVIACSIYVGGRLITALRPIYRLLKEQSASGQRVAAAIPTAAAAVPAPQPSAASPVPPSNTMQRERAAAASHVPAPTLEASAVTPAVEVAAAVAPEDVRAKVQTQQGATASQHPMEAPTTPAPVQTQVATPAPGKAAADSNPHAPSEPPMTEHTEVELEAQRARVRQMVHGH